MNARTVDKVRNPARGLYLLMQKPEYFQCPPYEQVVVHQKHPFGLETEEGQKICFVWGGHTDASVEAFVLMFRELSGYTIDERLRELRIISAPWSESSGPNENHVFFEARFEHDIIISGETTDFSGGGNASRNDLEDIFDALSKVYGVAINRVKTGSPADMPMLYGQAIGA